MINLEDPSYEVGFNQLVDKPLLRVQLTEPFQQQSKLFGVGVLRFEGHLSRFGEITCTHNLECSAIDDFSVIMEVSFKPLASFLILALNNDGASLERVLRILAI